MLLISRKECSSITAIYTGHWTIWVILQKEWVFHCLQRSEEESIDYFFGQTFCNNKCIFCLNIAYWNRRNFSICRKREMLLHIAENVRVSSVVPFRHSPPVFRPGSPKVCMRNFEIQILEKFVWYQTFLLQSLLGKVHQQGSESQDTFSYKQIYKGNFFF